MSVRLATALHCVTVSELPGDERGLLRAPQDSKDASQQDWHLLHCASESCSASDSQRYLASPLISGFSSPLTLHSCQV